MSVAFFSPCLSVWEMKIWLQLVSGDVSGPNHLFCMAVREKSLLAVEPSSNSMFLQGQVSYKRLHKLLNGAYHGTMQVTHYRWGLWVIEWQEPCFWLMQQGTWNRSTRGITARRPLQSVLNPINPSPTSRKLSCRTRLCDRFTVWV